MPNDQKKAEKKVDRRVKYSKMVIKNSFIKLLKEKSIAKITIKEICALADVNRATFYAHYIDQYDLLHQIESDLVDDVKDYLANYDPNAPDRTTAEMLEKILEYIKANAELVDLLLNANGDISFEEDIIMILARLDLLPTAIGKDMDQEDAEYAFLFFANGCIGVIKQWLKDGMTKPTHDTALLIYDLITKGQEKFFLR
ncbi:MAG TPA: TetR/AcrR family transcriptional regulator C-terminal domain-containing protein [Clostridiales bacterium]|nr:TetR/AcrR family transcriptional regulator C-terminal domain-containing protein [Clostridiales bacterium]